MTNRFIPKVLQLCLVALLAVGQSCDRYREPKYEACSQEEVVEFGDLLKDAFYAENRETLVARSDHRRLSWRATGEKYTGKMLDGFTTGVKKSFSFPNFILGDLGIDFSHMHILGPRKRKGVPVLRTRMSTLLGDMSYVDVFLEKRTDDKDTRVVITDMYIFRGGNWFSEAMANNMESAGLNPDDEDDVAIARLKNINKAVELYNAGQVEEAELLRGAMIPGLRNSKLLLVNRFYALLSYDSTAFEDAFSEFKALYPDDEAIVDMELLLAFGGVDTTRMENAIASFKASIVGEDGYLYYLRSLLMVEKGRLDDGLEMAQKAVEMEPEMECFREQLMNCYIFKGQYSSAVNELRVIAATEYVSDAELGYAPEVFYESAPFREYKLENPEKWAFLDEDYEEDWDEFEDELEE